MTLGTALEGGVIDCADGSEDGCNEEAGAMVGSSDDDVGTGIFVNIGMAEGCSLGVVDGITLGTALGVVLEGDDDDDGFEEGIQMGEIQVGENDDGSADGTILG